MDCMVESTRALGLSRMARSAQWAIEADRMWALHWAAEDAAEAAAHNEDWAAEQAFFAEADYLRLAAAACGKASRIAAGLGDWQGPALLREAEAEARALHPAVGL